MTASHQPEGGTDEGETPPHSMLIDDYLPDFDVTQRRHTVVDASPEETYVAAVHADLMETGLFVRLLNELRILPSRIASFLDGTAQPKMPAMLTIEDIADQSEYVVLGDNPGREYLLGAIGKFWKPEIEWISFEPATFQAFNEPGYAKLAIDLSMRPYGTNRTLLSYEARTATTNRISRWLFRLYWEFIGPFAGYLMQQVLERIRQDAETSSQAQPTKPGW